MRRSVKYLVREVARSVTHAKNTLIDPRPKLVTLLYHRVLPEVSLNPFSTVVSFDTFAEQLDAIARKYPVISLGDAMDQCRSEKAKAKVQAVLSFDDGYWDNYEFVFPLLRKKGLTGVFSPVTDYIGKDVPLWEWELVELLGRDKTVRSVTVGDRAISARPLEPWRFFAVRIFGAMKSQDPKTRQRDLDSLKERVHDSGARVESSGRRGSMTWDEVRRMIDCGMEIGAHGMTHRSLGQIPPAEASQEILGSKEAIERALGRPCRHFTFPFGSGTDFNEALVDYAREVGFRSCASNVRGYNHIEKGTFCLFRVIMEESTSLDHLLG